MNIAHPVSDLVIRIKNASLAHRKEVMIPFSNMNKQVLQLLKVEGFIQDVKEVSEKDKKSIKVEVKYNRRYPALTNVKIVSKPSLRVYKATKDIAGLEIRGRHTVVLSTSQGIMTGREARKKGVGGEILFEVW